MQVCSAETIGGGERHVIDLTRALIERGHRLHLVVRPGSPLCEAVADLPVSVHKLPLRNSVDLLSVWRLSRLLRRESIDVLHAHVGRDYIVCGLAAWLFPAVRFFITRHHFNPFRTFLTGYFYSMAIARVDTLIAVSQTVRDRLVAAFPRLSARVRVVPNWHHLPGPDISSDCAPQLLTAREEARARLGITRPLAIGIIGQISPLKGQHIFVEAAMTLLAEPLGAGLEFLIIGSAASPDLRYAHRLADQVARAGWGEQIRLKGYFDRIDQVMSGLDIITILSMNEAFSLVLLEAMAAGLPVVATRVGGMAEIIREGETGLFTERDPVSLANVLTRLTTDQALRLQLGTNAAIEVRTKYDREAITGIIEKLMTRPTDLPLPP